MNTVKQWFLVQALKKFMEDKKMMGGWKTWLSIVGMLGMAAKAILEEDYNNAVNYILAAATAVGLGSKIEKK